MFDIDDTICRTFNAKYSEAIPIKKRIKIINKLYDEGYYIKIFKQLVSWGLKFNELIMGKPTYDIYIDDKSYNSKEKKTFNNIYKLIS